MGIRLPLHLLAIFALTFAQPAFAQLEEVPSEETSVVTESAAEGDVAPVENAASEAASPEAVADESPYFITEVPPEGQETATAHAEASSGLPQFNPEWFPAQVFWLLVFFGALYVIFAGKILPTMTSTMETRRDRLENDLQTADRLAAEAEDTRAQVEQDLNVTRNRAADLTKQAEDQVSAHVEERTQAFRTRAADAITQLEADLDHAKQQAKAEIHTSVADLAAQAVEKVTGVKVTAKQAQDVINDNAKKSHAA